MRPPAIRTIRTTLLILCAAAATTHADERRFVTNIRQITFEGRRAGEGYFNTDGSMMVFQSEREPGNPFFQIYVLDLTTGETTRVSPGHGKTTCAWIHPDARRVIFASTQDDPEARAKQETELRDRAAGRARRYAWDYDTHYEIYVADLGGTQFRNLTRARGYDAEGSFSPDGSLVAFASNRHAYTQEHSPEHRRRLETDPSTFLDIYLMNADGSNVRRLTNVPGYDGGPFFSPDGRRICWRRFTVDGNTAEVWTMNIDGTDARQITRLNAMSWAPYYHPSGDYLIFTTDKHGRSNFELYAVDVHGQREPIRITHTDGFDGLPVFAPDGARLAWTSKRTSDGTSQIFFADWNDREARAALGIAASSGTSMPGPHRRRREAPITVPNITAGDIETHAHNMAVILADSAAGEVRFTQAVTEYIAATFGRLGLEPAGQSASLFQFCEFPLFSGGDRKQPAVEVGCNVLARLHPPRAVDSRALVIGAHLGRPEDLSDAERLVSGVAGVLEIAEFMADEYFSGRLALKRDVVFAAFVGEPVSAGFVTETLGVALAPIAGAPSPIAAFIGLDQIGHLDGPVLLSGVGTSPVWRREIERRNVPVGLNLETRAAPTPGSVAIHFYAGAVPSLSATLAAPAQGASPLNSAGAEKIARLMFLVARSLATSSSPPEFRPISERQGAKTGRPYLGTEPDYTAPVTGVKLKGVAEDGPAARAGLRAGDLILALNGTAINDVNDYAKVIDTLRVGDDVPVTVLRGQEKKTLRLRVAARN